MTKKAITTAQTIGPFPHEGWRWAFELADGGTPSGPAVTLAGRVLDGDGAPIDDAIIEAWSPAAAAREADRPLPGLRRVPSDAQGEFRCALPRPAQPGAPLAYVTVFARGLLKHQFCAVFLEDDPALGDAPLLAQVPAERRATLVAARADAPGAYRWDIRLQGERETVFFDYE